MWSIMLIISAISMLAALKGRDEYFCFGMIFLVTGGFQCLPGDWFVSPLLLAKPYDYGYLLAAFLIFLRMNSVVYLYKRIFFIRVIAFYILFLLLDFLYSIFVEHYEIVLVVQSLRIFLWPLFFVSFFLCNSNALTLVFELIKNVVFFQSILYLQQYVTGFQVLGLDAAIYNPYSGSSDFLRFLSIPDFLIFLIAYFFFRQKYLDLKMVAFCASQFASLTRTVFAGTIFSIGLVYLIKKGGKAAIFSILGLVIVFCLGGFLMPSQFVERIDDAVEDISLALDGNAVQGEQFSGTFGFRVAHLQERLDYVWSNPKYWVFGRGMIHETSPEAGRLGFRVGLPDLDTGAIIQVDTADIAWSLFLVKTGFVGCLFIFAIYYFLYKFVSSSISIYSTVASVGVLYYFFTSFSIDAAINPSKLMQLSFFIALAHFYGDGSEES